MIGRKMAILSNKKPPRSEVREKIKKGRQLMLAASLLLLQKPLLRHIAQFPAITVVVLNHLAHELLRVDGVGVCLVECGVAIVD